MSNGNGHRDLKASSPQKMPPTVKVVSTKHGDHPALSSGLCAWRKIQNPQYRRKTAASTGHRCILVVMPV